ncbi:MAG: hypothetical protein NUV98_04480, partial [Candidatus Roizmanbacteria bacterium]|nr:hypothetical protein [Candidatus Roizmanbacteria bacterium]
HDMDVETAVQGVEDNLSNYEREYAEDKVSSYYPYYFVWKDGSLRISSREAGNENKDLVENQIDPEERNGLTLEGWKTFEKKLTEAPNGSYFTWVSPRGLAGTTGEMAKITYPYHQIYVGQIIDHKIDTWALKCDMNESDLAAWLADLSESNDVMIDVSDEYFLMNSTISPRDPLSYLQTFMNHYGIQSPFYKKVSLQDVVREMKQEKGKVSSTVVAIINDMRTALYKNPQMSLDDKQMLVQGAYFGLLGSYQDARGNIKLSGSCQGSVSINDILGSDSVQNHFGDSSDTHLSGGPASIFSTEFRMESSTLSTSESTRTLACKECPLCHAKNIVAKIQNGKIHCPECKESVPYQC